MKTQMIRVRSDVRYIGSTSDLTRISVHLVQSLAEADLLYVTIYQTRAQLLARNALLILPNLYAALPSHARTLVI